MAHTDEQATVNLEKVTCPTCHGRPYISPRCQRKQELCPMCNNKGFVFRQVECECGRPAVRAVENELICLSLTCLKRVVDRPAPKKIEVEEKNPYDGLSMYTGEYYG